MAGVTLETKTPWGKIAAIFFRSQDGERYYMMVKSGSVALMPATVVEQWGRKEG